MKQGSKLLLVHKETLVYDVVLSMTTNQYNEHIMRSEITGFCCRFCMVQLDNLISDEWTMTHSLYSLLLSENTSQGSGKDRQSRSERWHVIGSDFSEDYWVFRVCKTKYMCRTCWRWLTIAGSIIWSLVSRCVTRVLSSWVWKYLLLTQWAFDLLLYSITSKDSNVLQKVHESNLFPYWT